jgi:hypothetical protein
MFDFLTNPTWVNVAVVWIGALCTLGIYTILYRENKIFRFFEHLFIGLATGYTIYVTWNDVLKPSWWEPMTKGGQWWQALFLPAGLLFYTIYSRRHAWMSRLIFGVFFGAAAGLNFQGFAAYYFPLARSVVNVPLIHPAEGYGPGAYALSPISAVINNVLFLVILIAVMSYFFFSFEQKNKVVSATSKLGRYILMFAFGAIFGSTIGARMNLLIGRLYYLIHDWAQVIILHHKP